MLKQRVLSSLVGLAILFTVLFSNQIVLGVVIFIVALIGVNEFYDSISKAGYRPIKTIGYLCCVPILVIGLNGVFKKVDSYVALFKSINYFSLCIFAILLVLFIIMIFQQEKYNIVDMSLTFMGTIYVSFLFAFIVLTRNLDVGKTAGVDEGFLLIWLIFIGAWGTDTFAYFIGRYTGKHLLMPSVSPKKTVEGSIGGIIGCVVLTTLYGIFLNSRIVQVNLGCYALLGLINSIIAQLGDFGASAIKRYVKIKDYGSIMPGHGGVLDRFDSILFIAPVVYFYMSFLLFK